MLSLSLIEPSPVAMKGSKNPEQLAVMQGVSWWMVH